MTNLLLLKRNLNIRTNPL